MEVGSYSPRSCPWATRTLKSGPHDEVTTFVCTDRRRRQLVQEVRSALSDDLRKPEYRGNPNPVAGHCYVASEVLYHRLGGKGGGWTPQSVRHEGGPHWFLRHQDGTIIDPTADQFETPVPYDRARGCGFLTREPSARARTIIDRMA